jgi:LuxR family maltose regulon positive regulatory protein
VAYGDLDGAVGMIEQAQPMYLPGYFPEVRPTPAVLARTRIAQGRLADAAAWASQHQVSAEDRVSYLAEYNQLTLARLLIAQHCARQQPNILEDALTLLNRIVAVAEGADRGGSLIESLLVRALGHRARGDLHAALADLGRSLSVGVPLGYCRLFLDEGPAMDELLHRLVARPDLIGSDEATALLKAAERQHDARPDIRAPRPGGREPLSEREVEVLQLLATQLSGPEIADRLFMSVNTFRTHTRHIFTKLDVNTRRAAVNRAGELDLL